MKKNYGIEGVGYATVFMNFVLYVSIVVYKRYTEEKIPETKRKIDESGNIKTYLELGIPSIF